MNAYTFAACLALVTVGALGLGYQAGSVSVYKKQIQSDRQPNNNDKISQVIAKEQPDSHPVGDAEKYEGDSKKKNKLIQFFERYEKPIAGLGVGLTAVFTIVLALATIQLTNATNQLRDYAAEQAGDMKISIEAARDSVRLARVAIDLDRAWIGAPKIEIVTPANGVYAFHYTAKNSGKAPVRGLVVQTEIYSRAEYDRVTAEGAFVKIRDRTRIIFESRDKVADFKHLIVPQEELSMQVSDDPAAKITEDQISNIIDRGIDYFVVGAIVYGSGRDDPAYSREFMHTTVFRGDVVRRDGRPSMGTVWAFDAD